MLTEQGKQEGYKYTWTQAGALKYKTFIERTKSINNNKKTHTEGTLTSGKIKITMQRTERK